MPQNKTSRLSELRVGLLVLLALAILVLVIAIGLGFNAIVEMIALVPSV